MAEKKAPDLTLEDQDGKNVTLSSLWTKGPLLVVFYPGDDTPVCTAQLCDYRDKQDDFKGLGIQVVGISKDTPESHRKFKAKHNLPFSLLSDPKNQAAKAFGAQSIFILGMVSRAAFIVGKNGDILYSKVEPTPVTRPKTESLLPVIEELRQKNLI